MEKIADELSKMRAEDQRVRWAWEKARSDKTVTEVALARIKAEWMRVDNDNLARLKVIFAEYGYPDIIRFGGKAAHDFWLLVQHCDQAPYFQLEVLAAMEPLLKTKNIDLGDYAYLYDRVYVNTGQLQRYGTQIKKREDGIGYEPKPLENPELVDERRAEMGLTPLVEYLEQMQAVLPTR